MAINIICKEITERNPVGNLPANIGPACFLNADAYFFFGVQDRIIRYRHISGTGEVTHSWLSASSDPSDYQVQLTYSYANNVHINDPGTGSWVNATSNPIWQFAPNGDPKGGFIIGTFKIKEIATDTIVATTKFTEIFVAKGMYCP